VILVSTIFCKPRDWGGAIGPIERPFEVDEQNLRNRLEEFVNITIADLKSEFLILPKGRGFIEYIDFRDAYEVLKRVTGAFTTFSPDVVHQAVVENARVFCVVRAILGMTPGEWADVARTELSSDIPQNAARQIDRACRANPLYVQEALDTRSRSVTLARIEALIIIAAKYLTEGAPSLTEGILHRLDKFDTKSGLASIRYAATEEAPYAVLLYERHLGRPFAGHRDAISELVGEVMENAVEEQLRAHSITFRKTKRAERIPGFGQAPDFCIPDENTPSVVIEAKVTSDDGTARDKVARIKVLATQRDRHVAAGMRPYEVVACIDGRGFRQRREDMRQMLLELKGKVFTASTLDQLVENTRLREFVSRNVGH
jgi:hypothetical protein